MTSSASPRAYGRYQLLESIGCGSIAEVFKAKSFGVEGFEKTLVVKCIVPELARDAAFIESFVREAKLVVRLSHANVVQVFDLGRVDEPAGSSYFMAMEYVAGIDLATLYARLREQKREPPIELAVYVASEVSKALDHAHRRRDEQLRTLGIVHGAVAPHNVLLSWEGEVKVSDFGIARALHEAYRAGARALPLLSERLMYMSPEQLRGELVGAPSDLFSLGVLLYEILAGAHPFSAATAQEVRGKIVEARFEPLDRVRRDLAPELVGLVHRALSLRPEARFDGAARLYEELVAHLYASGAHFSASDLSELIAEAREPRPTLPVSEAIDHVLSGADVTPSSGTIPVAKPAPPELELPAPVTHGWAEEGSALVLRFSGAAPVPAATRDRARQILLRYGARIFAESSRELAAMFGVQQADGRDTENAVRSGLVLLRSLAAGSAVPAVGVDAGRLHVGEEGAVVDDERSRALILNARRLASIAEQRVAIAERAAKNLRGLFNLEPAPVGSLPRNSLLVGDVRAPQEAFGRFVGRKKELRELGQALAQGARRQAQVVGLVGEHGVGKTRLIYEMERRIARASFSIACYVAACPPLGHESPASAIAAMLRTLCGVREGDPADRVAGVEPRLRALGLREEQVQAVLAELGALRSEGPSASSSLLGAAFAQMLASLAEDRLHVFAWDNAHELDAESLALLGGALERVAQSSVVLLFAARPHENAGYGTLPGYTEIPVHDLEEDDALRLVASRLGVEEVPEPLTAFVRERAGGHPMFIEELLHEALESSAVRVRDGCVESLRLDGALAVPRPLRSLLGDRIRRLPDAERDLLVAATVLGAPVDTSLLAVMLDVPLGTVNALAESLEGKELLRRDGPVALSFPSPLLPEVVSNGLERDERIELHQRAANAYQMVLGERTEEEAGRIAHHLAEAGQRDRAAGFFATSGLFFLSARRLDRAVADLGRALDLAELNDRSSDELAEWISALSRAVRHVRSGTRLPDLIRRLSAHVEANRELDPRQRVQMTIDLALILGSLHRYKDARRLLKQAAAGAQSWPELLRSALTAEAEVALSQGEFKIAVRALDKAGQLGPGDALEQHRLLVATAQSLGGVGEYERALAYLEQAAALAPPDDVVLACQRAKVRALVLGLCGDWRGCAEACEQGAEQGRAAGLLSEVAVNLHNQGDSLMRLGELPRAYASLQASADIAEELGSERIVNLNKMMLAYLDALNGSESAQHALGERLAHAEAQRWTWDGLTGRYLLGKLLARRGDHDAARRELVLARQMARSTDNHLAVKDCDEELAQLAAP
jgi:eukaryotic-like serine/threonine-protein kinase